MLPVLINHNDDLRRLQEEGYQIEVSGGYLVIHHIPYVNSHRHILYGKLVCPLTVNAGKTMRPQNHVIQFCGEYPCNADGTPILQIQHTSGNQQLTPEIVTNHSFSNKPAAGYADYYEKVSTYATIIASQAKSIDPTVTERTFVKMEGAAEDSVFQYPDTNAIRANIGIINRKLAGQKLAIVGLGGTGGYVLDLVAKAPASEIHLFDGDVFLQHNAFRAPGAPSIAQLSAAVPKVVYFKQMYENMHKYIFAHPHRILEDNLDSLAAFDFVFLCIDSNAARAYIIKYLLANGIPFVDCGIGLEVVEDQLIGAVRITAGTASKADHLPHRVPLRDAEDDLYTTNIQIADLNMLNAFLAVHKWKKMSGFYQDLIQEHNAIFTINTAQLDATDATA
ncbi:ThiF family adenylyltransferase [Chitinophaga pollutisoli]|uniref:ThiF family adenylyltransferase n=1 Tax=Chitinophaga pollutisoli TaxID=3133966 RepID=A0ABZ2YQC8_9BACT